MAASLAGLALLMLSRSAWAQLTVTTANQQGTANTWPFTPSWTVNTNGSLVAGLTPSTANGNFSLEIAGRSVNSLTVNTNLTIGIIQPSTTTSTNYVTCGNGSGAGSLIIYTLPASAHGYNLTNITVYGGWANNGRDAQGFTLLYSTVDNPASFKFLTVVNYNPSVPNNTASANREIINDASGGLIAANVAALEFDFSNPQVENGYTGYSALTVGGTPASSVVTPAISLTTSNQTGSNPFTPSWTAETPDLIAGLSPSTTFGTFTLEGSGGTPVLTDGTIGISGNVSYFATCGAGGGSGSLLIYTLTNVVNGSDVTNIVVYSGWADSGRDGEYYKLSYSTVSAPTTYIPITTVYYNPQGISGASANRVAISMNDGSPLGTAVANLKFDFSGPPSAGTFDNAYQGYSEIIVQGHDTAAPPPPPSPYLTQDTLPSYAETVVGDQVVFTAAFSNAPPANVQWQFVTTNNTATNNIAGATNGTLTLNNVQLTNTGFYRLKAVNATNGAAAPAYSSATLLAVSNTPAAVNNVIANYAGQCGLGGAGTSTNFYPTWTIDTNNDLILGFTAGGGPGTFTAGAGNYGLSQANGDPTILSDGSFGYLNYWPNVGASPSLVTCGSSQANPGTSMTYELITNSAPSGFDLTNITVYGGWGDGGRDEQKYEVKYSTVANPTLFNSLVTVDYNPNDPNGVQTATRTTLVPASGVLAQNVYAVEINWGLQGSPPKNGYEGYSEIIVKGTPSPPKPVLTQDVTPLAAQDVVGDTLTMTAGFSGATSYQWQKNGTNLIGQTTPTLTLSNLQLGDTATNGGYRLTASNGAGTSVTRGCSVIVRPVPAAIGNVVIALANQSSDASSFTPTWDTSSFSSSLISGASPSDFGPGNFNDPDPNPVSFNMAGGLPVLTDGNYGSIVDGGPHPAFATCGPTAGQYVTYTLPATANGYDLTNVVIASGWNDDGRNANWCTLSYSTVSNPAMFFAIAVVTNTPTLGIKSEIRATLTPAGGLLASNVYAVKLEFIWPQGIPNGYSGFSQINIYGSPSANPPPAGPVITVQHEETNNTFVVETPNLIAHQLPSSYGPGVFTLEGCNETNLTDGVIGFGAAYGASCGADGLSVPWIIFDSASGWNLTNIIVYTLWHDYGRVGQFYNLSYSTLSAPTTFLPLASVAYDPFVPADGRACGNRVAIAPAPGQSLLASNVYAVMFDFTPQGSQDFGWSGYTEIVLLGSNLAPATPPVVSATQSGGNLILRGTGATPNYAYDILTTTNILSPLSSWTVIATGATDGSGAISNAIPINLTNRAGFFRCRMP